MRRSCEANSSGMTARYSRSAVANSSTQARANWSAHRLVATGAAEIEISGVHKSYVDAGVGLTALEGISMSIRSGGFICLLGPSGCGKTPLLNCIAGFVRPTSGTILMNGKPVASPGADRGVVFQEYGLLPWYTVAQNVGLGPRIRKLSATE